MSKVVGLLNNSYKPITNTAGVRARLCKLQKRCTRLAAASDNVYQLLAHGRWFSLGTPASSITKTGRHDIAEILLKVELKHKQFKIIPSDRRWWKIGSWYKGCTYMLLGYTDRWYIDSTFCIQNEIMSVYLIIFQWT